MPTVERKTQPDSTRTSQVGAIRYDPNAFSGEAQALGQAGKAVGSLADPMAKFFQIDAANQIAEGDIKYDNWLTENTERFTDSPELFDQEADAFGKETIAGMRNPKAAKDWRRRFQHFKNVASRKNLVAATSRKVKAIRSTVGSKLTLWAKNWGNAANREEEKRIENDVQQYFEDNKDITFHKDELDLLQDQWAVLKASQELEQEMTVFALDAIKSGATEVEALGGAVDEFDDLRTSKDYGLEHAEVEAVIDMFRGKARDAHLRATIDLNEAKAAKEQAHANLVADAHQKKLGAEGLNEAWNNVRLGLLDAAVVKQAQDIIEKPRDISDPLARRAIEDALTNLELGVDAMVINGRAYPVTDESVQNLLHLSSGLLTPKHFEEFDGQLQEVRTGSGNLISSPKNKNHFGPLIEALEERAAEIAKEDPGTQESEEAKQEVGLVKDQINRWLHHPANENATPVQKQAFADAIGGQARKAGAVRKAADNVGWDFRVQTQQDVARFMVVDETVKPTSEVMFHQAKAKLRMLNGADSAEEVAYHNKWGDLYDLGSVGGTAGDQAADKAFIGHPFGPLPVNPAWGTRNIKSFIDGQWQHVKVPDDPSRRFGMKKLPGRHARDWVDLDEYALVAEQERQEVVDIMRYDGRRWRSEKGKKDPNRRYGIRKFGGIPKLVDLTEYEESRK